jgi:hypothetical protein
MLMTKDSLISNHGHAKLAAIRTTFPVENIFMREVDELQVFFVVFVLLLLV